MKIHRIPALLVCLGFPAAVLAQSTRTFHVRGEIANFPVGETISVELRPLNQAGAMFRELAANDGSFDIHNVEAGTYDVNVVSSRGASLRREVVHLDAFANRITLQLPKAPSAAGAGTARVSSIERGAQGVSKGAVGG